MLKIDNILYEIQDEFLNGNLVNDDKIASINSNDLGYILSHIDDSAVEPMISSIIKSAAQKLPEIIPELSKPVLIKTLGILYQSNRPDIITKIFNELDIDDGAQIIASIPQKLSKWILKVIDLEDYSEVKELFKYPEESSGRIMTPEFFSVDQNNTILETFNQLKITRDDAETIYYIYIVDGGQKLVGVASIRDLLFRANEVKMSEIMIQEVVSVKVTDDQEKASRLVEHYNLSALPVLDDDGVIRGIITVDDVIGIIRHETTEDIMKLAGTASAELNKDSPFRSFRLRVPWLMVSFTGGLLTVKIMNELTTVISNIVYLVFIPVILGMGGNVASQSSAIIVRGLAIGQIHVNKIWTVLWQEVFTALLLGFFFGVLLYFTSQWEFQGVVNLGFAVALGIMFSMLLAAFFSTALPIFFHKISIDPAVATGPFVTVSIDILGILIYIAAIQIVESFS